MSGSRLLPILIMSAAVAGEARAETGVSVSAPLPLILGDIEDVSLTIEVEENTDNEGRPLQVAVNVGTIESLQRIGRGKYTAHYTLPRTKFPQVALLAYWFETGPDAVVEFARIPLYARTKLPYHAKAGATITVEVGKDTFGPVTADRKGMATVPIVVPPGVRDVVLVVDKNRSTFPVKVPKYNRLAIVTVPYKVPADGKTATTVHAYYDAEVPPSITSLKLSVPLGELKPIPGGAHFLVQYTPAAGLALSEVIIGATMDIDSDAKATARLLIGQPVPTKLIVSALDRKAEMGSNVPFAIAVVDDRGLGVPGQTIVATPSAGKIESVEDAGFGRYRAVLLAPAERPPDGRVSVEFRMQHESGPLVTRVETTVPDSAQIYVAQHGTLPPSGPPILFMGARAGGAYEGVFSPMAGLEVALRPRVLDQKLDFYLGANYRVVSQKFVVKALMNANVSSSLVRIPVTVGVGYAFVQSDELRVYGTAKGGIALLSQSITSDLEAAQSLHHIDPTAEVGGGLSYGGIFLELGGIFMPISSRELSGPAINFSATLGYRLGLL